MLDPSKLTKSMITLLWAHWTERAKSELPILAFIKARESDLGLSAMAGTVETDLHLFQKKRAAAPYVDVGSDDEPSDDDSGDHAGNGNRARSPPSKRLCLRRLSVDATLAVHAESISPAVSEPGSPAISEPRSPAISEPRSPAVSGSRNPAVPETESPATAINDDDKQKFLYSLSTDASYTSLLSHVLALPGIVSIFPSACINLSNYQANYGYIQGLGAILFLGFKLRAQFTCLGILEVEPKVSSSGHPYQEARASSGAGFASYIYICKP